MFNKNTQFINIIKSQQNIKINYQILNDNKIIKSEHSTFLLENNKISNDAILKIESLKNSTSNTYITALCENSSQKIITNESIISNTLTTAYFDTRNSIVLDNTEFENNLNFYGKDNTNYFISPFSILQNIMSEKLDEKSLNMLVHNEYLYAIYSLEHHLSLNHLQ